MIGIYIRIFAGMALLASSGVMASLLSWSVAISASDRSRDAFRRGDHATGRRLNRIESLALRVMAWSGILAVVVVFVAVAMLLVPVMLGIANPLDLR